MNKFSIKVRNRHRARNPLRMARAFLSSQRPAIGMVLGLLFVAAGSMVGARRLLAIGSQGFSARAR
jgi:hypothetical protein